MADGEMRKPAEYLSLAISAEQAAESSCLHPRGGLFPDEAPILRLCHLNEQLFSCGGKTHCQNIALCQFVLASCHIQDTV